MDRGRGRGGGRQGSFRDDSGGKNKSSGPAPQFVKNIPSFLQQYSHLLNTNKKNYMGEDVGRDDVAETAEEVLNCGGVVVSEHASSEDGEDTPVVVEAERGIGDVFRQRAPGLSGIECAAATSHSSSIDPKPNEIKKIAFRQPVKRRIAQEEADGGSCSKRSCKGSNNTSILSFDMEDDEQEKHT